jgi:hypothetical protein
MQIQLARVLVLVQSGISDQVCSKRGDVGNIAELLVPLNPILWVVCMIEPWVAAATHCSFKDCLIILFIMHFRLIFIYYYCYRHNAMYLEGLNDFFFHFYNIVAAF